MGGGESRRKAGAIESDCERSSWLLLKYEHECGEKRATTGNWVEVGKVLRGEYRIRKLRHFFCREIPFSMTRVRKPRFWAVCAARLHFYSGVAFSC